MGIDLWKECRMSLAAEEQEELLRLCRELTPISDTETQELLKQWYLDSNSVAFTEGNEINIRFSEKYGHSYTFKLSVYEGKLFIWRGYSSSGVEITFFEDNGIVEWVEKITTPVK